jgi:threonine/homoserine/homoserine lactone efflux protein
MTAALLAFAVAATLLIVSPGPDTMLVMRNTLRGGRSAGWVTATGTMSGLLIWAVSAALGLTALLRVSRVGFDVVRLAGAAYLIWLGVSSLGLIRRRHAARGQATGTPADPTPADPTPGGWGHVYLNGVLSNLLNPKIGVFFVAFLPGFTPARVPVTLFTLGLGLWFTVETGAWLGVLAWLVARGADWLRRSAVQRWLERATGVVLIAFGVRLATESR